MSVLVRERARERDEREGVRERARERDEREGERGRQRERDRVRETERENPPAPRSCERISGGSRERERERDVHRCVRTEELF
jgi:hypothetical protein